MPLELTVFMTQRLLAHNIQRNLIRIDLERDSAISFFIVLHLFENLRCNHSGIRAAHLHQELNLDPVTAMSPTKPAMEHHRLDKFVDLHNRDQDNSHVDPHALTCDLLTLAVPVTSRPARYLSYV